MLARDRRLGIVPNHQDVGNADEKHHSQFQPRGVDPPCVGLLSNAPEHRCDPSPTPSRHFSYLYTSEVDIFIAGM